MIIKNLYYFLIKNKILQPKAKKISAYFDGKSGIEIGGKSLIFSKDDILPIYNVAANIDNCDFSQNTLWRKDIVGEYRFAPGKKGRQFIADAVDLNMIVDHTYDFLICSNVIEHIANPIRAINEWKRVVKKKGYILIVAPNKVSNFDHKRATTLFEHLVQDYQNGVQETDLAHLKEIVENHDYTMDIKSHNKRLFIKRCEDNCENRGMHHHVYSMDLLKELFEYVGIKTVMTYDTYYDFIILGKCK